MNREQPVICVTPVDHASSLDGITLLDKVASQLAPEQVQQHTGILSRRIVTFAAARSDRSTSRLRIAIYFDKPLCSDPSLWSIDLAYMLLLDQ